MAGFSLTVLSTWREVYAYILWGSDVHNLLTIVSGCLTRHLQFVLDDFDVFMWICLRIPILTPSSWLSLLGCRRINTFATKWSISRPSYCVIYWCFFLQTGLVIVDGWLKLTAPAQTAVLFKELRLTLHSVLKELIRKPEVTFMLLLSCNNFWLVSCYKCILSLFISCRVVTFNLSLTCFSDASRMSCMSAAGFQCPMIPKTHFSKVKS